MTAGVLYGTGANTINMQGSSHFGNTTANFTGSFTAPGLVTGIQLNGSATGMSNCSGTINVGISTTPAHLDAACGAAGFNKAAYNWAGASVANFQIGLGPLGRGWTAGLAMALGIALLRRSDRTTTTARVTARRRSLRC